MFRLHMGWRHVLFANWTVDPDVVDAHLPDALTVDTYDGDAWLSVVPFTNVDVRPTWAPAGWGVRLPEINLRTYVTHDGDPGVYFFSLDAEGVLGVTGARLFHRLPYFYARQSLETAGESVHFRSRRFHPGARPLAFEGTYAPTEEIGHAEEGTLDHFLVHRLRYYTDTGRGIRYADVDHEPWPLYRANATIGENGCFAANGFARPDGDPILLYSPGVDTVASRSNRVDR